MQGAETLMPHEIPVRPWQIVATDLFHFEGSELILNVDYYSKYPFVRKLNNFSSQEVINTMKQVFGENGIPERVISDNGAHYSSVAFKQFAKEWGFEHRTSSPRYPQSNGVVCSRLNPSKRPSQAAVTSTWYCYAFGQLR